MTKQTLFTIILFVVLAGLVGFGILELERTERAIIPESDTEKIPGPDLETGESIEEEIALLGPREVVQKFIEADMAGARLGGEIAKEAPEIGRYFRFPSTGWDIAMVIDKYEIIDEYPSENSDSYFVKVNYSCKIGTASGFTDIENEKVIKRIAGEEGEGVITSIPCGSFFQYICPRCFEEPEQTTSISFNAQKEIEIVTFQLTKDEEGWKIDFPIVMPHISEETLQKHLQSFQK